MIRASVCGSDLWWFRGIADRESGSLISHEAIGVVEEVSDDVTDIKPNDFVIVPFTHGCGHCVACINGFEGNCLNSKTWNKWWLSSRIYEISTSKFRFS